MFRAGFSAKTAHVFRHPALAAALIFLLSVQAPDVAEAAKVRALPSTVAVHDSLPEVRPEFPVPDDPNQLFFLQRSTNANTVVYAARFLPDGRLDPIKPLDAYWRRFNTTGERKALGFFENRFAFGVKTRPIAGENAYEVWFVAFPERRAVLTQDGPGKARISLKAGDYDISLAYGFVDVDQSGFIDEVVQVRIFGFDRATGKPVSEIVPISGGKIGLGGG